jgi:prepilin-type N-terminal cleavage/methylation domain-containing protein
MEVGKMKKERGFTLIELLVVIAILAILFGVTALLLTNVGNNAKRETAKAEADMVQTAIDVYMAVNSESTLSSGGSCEQAGDGDYVFDDYLRRTTRFYFYWDTDGNVTGAYENTPCTGGSNQLWTP